MKSMLVLVLLVIASSVSQAHDHRGGWYGGGWDHRIHIVPVPSSYGFFPAYPYALPPPVYLPAPAYLWTCTAYNSLNQPVGVGSSVNSQQAAWYAFNSCGGANNGCYVPAGGCR